MLWLLEGAKCHFLEIGQEDREERGVCFCMYGWHYSALSAARRRLRIYEEVSCLLQLLSFSHSPNYLMWKHSSIMKKKMPNGAKNTKGKDDQTVQKQTNKFTKQMWIYIYKDKIMIQTVTLYSSSVSSTSPLTCYSFHAHWWIITENSGALTLCLYCF